LHRAYYNIGAIFIHKNTTRKLIAFVNNFF